MQKLTAYVSGRIQKSGYRSKVVTIARVLGICGIIKNLADGRVKIQSLKAKRATWKGSPKLL